MPIAVNGSGTISGISTGGISDAKAVADAAMPAGSILQVVQTVKTDRSTISLATNTLTSDIMTVSITPQATSSKIFLQCSLNFICTTTGITFTFNKAGTDITAATGDAHGIRRRATAGQIANAGVLQNCTASFLDSPSTTSATTYGVKMAHSSGGTQTISVNHNDEANLAKFAVSICTLTAMEVAG